VIVNYIEVDKTVLILTCLLFHLVSTNLYYAVSFLLFDVTCYV